MSNKEIARPWIPGVGGALNLAIRKLRDRGQSDALVIYMSADAISGQFQAVAEVIESLCEVRVTGTARLFKSSTYDSPSMKILYGLANLPLRLFPLLTLSIDFALKFYVERGFPKGRKTRQLVLESLLDDERIKELLLQETDVKTLYALSAIAPTNAQELVATESSSDEEKSDNSFQ